MTTMNVRIGVGMPRGAVCYRLNHDCRYSERHNLSLHLSHIHGPFLLCNTEDDLIEVDLCDIVYVGVDDDGVSNAGDWQEGPPGPLPLPSPPFHQHIDGSTPQQSTLSTVDISQALTWSAAMANGTISLDSSTDETASHLPGSTSSETTTHITSTTNYHTTNKRRRKHLKYSHIDPAHTESASRFLSFVRVLLEDSAPTPAVAAAGSFESFPSYDKLQCVLEAMRQAGGGEMLKREDIGKEEQVLDPEDGYEIVGSSTTLTKHKIGSWIRSSDTTSGVLYCNVEEFGMLGSGRGGIGWVYDCLLLL